MVLTKSLVEVAESLEEPGREVEAVVPVREKRVGCQLEKDPSHTARIDKIYELQPGHASAAIA